jgi:hypothetical protein
MAATTFVVIETDLPARDRTPSMIASRGAIYRPKPRGIGR